MTFRSRLLSFWPVFGLLGLVFWGYRGIPSTGFSSEDFLILRHLHGRPLLDLLLGSLGSPWLNLETLNFYRPVSTFFLALELKVWGLDPRAFHLTQMTVHWASSCLVWAIVGRLTPASPRSLAVATAALFAVSPLHPSAVAFSGSYATLFGCALTLLSLWGFLLFRSSCRPRDYALSVGAFALALGSYEGAAVLPLCLAALVLIVPSRAHPIDRAAPSLGTTEAGLWRKRALRLLPFFLLLGLYFLIRKAALGVFVGGYGVFRERLLSRLGGLLMDFAGSLPLLLVPDLHPPMSRGLAAGLGGLLAAIILAFFLLRRRHNPLASVTLCALAWTASFELPFSFVRVVPATGRFWYLPSFAATLMGLALLQGLLAENRLGPLFKRTASLFWAALVALLLVFQMNLLRSDLAYYQEADLEIRQLRQAVASLPATGEPGTGPPGLGAWETVLVAGAPDFARTDLQQPVAKIFQYGLHESTSSPFVTEGPSVYSLPPDTPKELFPALARAAGGPVLVWNRKRRWLEPAAKAGCGPVDLPQIEFVPPVAAEPQEKGFAFRCTGCANPRLFLLTPGSPFRGEALSLREGKGWAQLPLAFLQDMASLYDDDALGWLEERDSKGRLTAISEVFTLHLSIYRGAG